MHDERDDAWTRYLTWRWADAELGVELDLGDAGLAAEQFTGAWEDRLTRALAAMAALEAGALANPDEGRQVGHYWLRAPSLAPDPAITAAIERSWEAIEAVAGPFRAGELTGSNGQVLDRVILVGIGGSALGPQLVADALAPAGARLTVLDNTDPIGMRRALAEHGPLAQSLALVVSKSGSTVETRNGMVELTAAFAGAGLSFEEHAVAITGPESQLDLRARGEGGGAPWRARLPLWDWVGGRTSVCSPVGLLPAALLGIDWRGLLAGAARMDAATRAGALRENPAITLARLWFSETGGRGERAMVVLPYRDRLVLLSRYLQQLVMESLGKRLDRHGNTVHQGLVVYGNKGSTDQHAYVQQLRDGRDD
ncbi:MAG: glucose-6-phosphate isomerase, partial [Myxococcales bacterium]|nr:glucose-6-phosphate isomerase [Myxococcales bacterium]